MVAIIQGTTPGDIGGALAILAAVRDPDTHEKRIAELQALADSASQMMDDVRAERQKINNEFASTKQDIEKAKALKSSIDADIAGKHAELDRRATALGERELAIKQREKELDDRDARLTNAESAYAGKVAAANARLDARAQDLDNRDTALKLKEAQVADREKAAAATKQQAERKLAAITAAASG